MKHVNAKGKGKKEGIWFRGGAYKVCKGKGKGKGKREQSGSEEDEKKEK